MQLQCLDALSNKDKDKDNQKWYYALTTNVLKQQNMVDDNGFGSLMYHNPTWQF